MLHKAPVTSAVFKLNLLDVFQSSSNSFGCVSVLNPLLTFMGHTQNSRYKSCLPQHWSAFEMSFSRTISIQKQDTTPLIKETGYIKTLIFKENTVLCTLSIYIRVWFTEFSTGSFNTGQDGWNVVWNGYSSHISIVNQLVNYLTKFQIVPFLL